MLDGQWAAKVYEMCRLNVEFSPSQSAALQRMAGELNETQAGVIRLALALLKLAIDEQKVGNSLGIVRGDRVVKEVVGLWSQEPVNA